MSTRATSGAGIEIQVGDGAGPEVFTTIGEVTDFDGPTGSKTEIVATSYDSEAVEKIAGLADNGEASFNMNFVGPDALQQQLWSDYDDGTTRNYKFKLNDHASTPSYFIFAAFVKTLKASNSGANDIVKLACSLSVTGAVTRFFAPA